MQHRSNRLILFQTVPFRSQPFVDEILERNDFRSLSLNGLFRS